MKMLAAVGLALLAFAAAISGAAAASFFAGCAAVALPQAFMLALAQKRGAQVAFSLWAGKFSMTVLFLAAGARFLNEAALLAGEFFAAGAVLGVVFNIAALVRRPAEAN